MKLIHFGEYAPHSVENKYVVYTYCGAPLHPNDVTWMDIWDHPDDPVTCHACIALHEGLLHTRYRPGPVKR